MDSNIIYIRSRRRRIVSIQRKTFHDRLNPFECEDKIFFQRYRLTKFAATYLIDILKEQLERPTKRSKAFPPHIIVLCSLSILGSGNFQFVSGQISFYNIQQPSISKIFSEFLSALVSKTKLFIKFPETPEDMAKIKRGFYNNYKFPNVIAAIDGTHIAIQKPAVQDAYSFFNRKSYYSINVQAVCDAEGIFNDVVVRWPGSTHDTHICKISSLYAFLHSPEFPDSTWLLGDSGYPLQHCVMTPVISPTSPAEINYVKMHKSARKIIEQSFGVLKSRFRVISKSGGELCYGLQKCVQIIMCCFVLHNFAQQQNVPNIEDGDDDEDDTDSDSDVIDIQNELEILSLFERRGLSTHTSLIQNMYNSNI